MTNIIEVAFRKNTDDDRWVIPEVIEQDMYRIKSLFASLQPIEPTYIIDCGAHIGAFSVMCAQYLTNVEIIAFEPNPESFFYLNQNAHRFGKIKAINKAISIAHGFLDLYAPNEIEWSGRWSSVPNTNEFLTVEAVGLFPFLAQLDRKVFILKMDIEGYEELLFQKLGQDDLSSVQIIIVETHTDNFDHEQLRQHGYQLLFNPEVSSARQFVYSKEPLGPK